MLDMSRNRDGVIKSHPTSQYSKKRVQTGSIHLLAKAGS